MAEAETDNTKPEITTNPRRTNISKAGDKNRDTKREGNEEITGLRMHADG
jgi:hypothetical protein